MAKAVIIAGDFRTFKYSIQSAGAFLEGADIFVSVWQESNFHHQTEPDKIYSCGSITEEQVREWLHPFSPTSVAIEVFDRNYWQTKGYNANFLHRLRVGIDLMRAVGKEYDSVLFVRPDMFFGNNEQLLEWVNNVKAGEFITIFSNEQRVHTHKTLNDTLFAVVGNDVDKAVPTVEFFQDHKHEDWHTFYRNFVVGNGLEVKNVERLQCIILRPPAVEGMTFETAVKNAWDWDDRYILKMIQDFGIERAIKEWSLNAVDRAVKNLLSGTSK